MLCSITTSAHDLLIKYCHTTGLQFCIIKESHVTFINTKRALSCLMLLEGKAKGGIIQTHFYLHSENIPSCFHPLCHCQGSGGGRFPDTQVARSVGIQNLNWHIGHRVGNWRRKKKDGQIYEDRVVAYFFTVTCRRSRTPHKDVTNQQRLSPVNCSLPWAFRTLTPVTIPSSRLGLSPEITEESPKSGAVSYNKAKSSTGAAGSNTVLRQGRTYW